MVDDRCWELLIRAIIAQARYDYIKDYHWLQHHPEKPDDSEKIIKKRLSCISDMKQIENFIPAHWMEVIKRLAKESL